MSEDLTVGALRRAIEGLPDETPIALFTEDFYSRAVKVEPRKLRRWSPSEGWFTATGLAGAPPEVDVLLIGDDT